MVGAEAAGAGGGGNTSSSSSHNSMEVGKSKSSSSSGAKSAAAKKPWLSREDFKKSIKAELVSNEWYSGKVKSIDGNFGFLGDCNCPQTKNDVFFHEDSLAGCGVVEKDQVEFQLSRETSSGKFRASAVRGGTATARETNIYMRLRRQEKELKKAKKAGEDKEERIQKLEKDSKAHAEHLTKIDTFIGEQKKSNAAIEQKLTKQAETEQQHFQALMDEMKSKKQTENSDLAGAIDKIDRKLTSLEGKVNTIAERGKEEVISLDGEGGNRKRRSVVGETAGVEVESSPVVSANSNNITASSSPAYQPAQGNPGPSPNQLQPGNTQTQSQTQSQQHLNQSQPTHPPRSFPAPQLPQNNQPTGQFNPLLHQGFVQNGLAVNAPGNGGFGGGGVGAGAGGIGS